MAKIDTMTDSTEAHRDHAANRTVAAAVFASLAGAVVCTVAIVAAIYYFVGQHESNDSMFGLVYLFLPFFTLPLGAFLGRLAHYWTSGGRHRGTGVDRDGMFFYGLLGVAPTVIAIGWFVYQNAEYKGAAWAGSIAAAAIALAAMVIVGALVTGKHIPIALVLVAAAVGAAFFADDTATNAQEQRITGVRADYLSEVNVLVLPAQSSEWQITSMRAVRFQQDRTARLELEDNDRTIHVWSNNRPYSSPCANPIEGQRCEFVESTSPGHLVEVSFYPQEAFATRYRVQSNSGIFTIDVPRDMATSEVLMAIESLQVATIDQWLARYEAVYD